MFSRLDDSDIFCCIKEWKFAEDFILSSLSRRLISRNLNSIMIQVEDFSTEFMKEIQQLTQKEFDIKTEEVHYFVYHHKIRTRSYNSLDTPILFKDKSNNLCNISELSTLLSDKEFNFTDVRYFMSYPRELKN